MEEITEEHVESMAKFLQNVMKEPGDAIQDIEINIQDTIGLDEKVGG